MKIFFLNNFLFLFLGFLLVRCYDEGKLVEITIPGKEPKLVIYSVIFPDGNLERVSPLGITISSSTHIYEGESDFITDAEVLLYKNGQFLGVLEYVDSLECYPLDDSPAYNDSYHIEVSKAGFPPAEGSLVVPNAIKLDTVIISPYAYFDEEGYLFSEVEIRFKDDPNETNFYEVLVFETSIFQSSTDSRPRDFQENAGFALELVAFDKVITEEPYYSSINKINEDYTTSLLFRDCLFNGEQYSLKVYFHAHTEALNRSHVVNHRLRVYLRKVTEDRFQFKTSMIQQYNHRQEDILYGVGEPVNVFSNIKNGYGLFGAYSYDSFLLSIDGFIAK